jgi:hypothetical protein
MPISNKSSQKRMTETTIRVDSNEALKRKQVQTSQRKPVLTTTNNNRMVETPPLYREPSPVLTRGSPRMFRVQRVSRAPQATPPREDITTKSVVVKDTRSRGTTPPPDSFYDRFPTNQSVYYSTRNQQPVSTVRYQTPIAQIHPTTTTRSEVFVQQQPLTNASTTTKTSTRILDATTMP